MTTTYILTTKIKAESFMGLFDYYGLIIMTVIMIPNIVYAVKHNDNGGGTYDNEAVIVAEQVSR